MRGSDEQRAAKPRRLGQPSLDGTPGESGFVLFRAPDLLRQKMKETAAAADITMSSFIRESVVKEILRRQDEADPETKEYLRELRKKYPGARRRALAGRFEPKE
jgi:hypothetical protein